jgi:ABC transporter substrate binding protein (PQQ-dependent alcohol dehydrogenase system)|tara:strand:+ start:285 stop:1484 length:1200 start_codon:yes stop_codon:yes gene_type:complete
MKLFFLRVTIFFICLIPINILNAEENPVFNIGYYDLEKDIRYDIWGVHPVDIRSNANQLYKRPIAGAELGLKDIKPFQRMSKVKFNLVKKRIKNNEDSAEVIYKHILENNIKFILLDFPASELLKITNKIIELNITSINVSSKNNELRSSKCNKNLFHTIPSERMLSDSLAQYLSEKKWRKILVLTGPLEIDKLKSNSFIESAKQFGLKIIDNRNFVLGNDPRAREQNDLDFLTGSAKYDAVYIADTLKEFSYRVPFATHNPAIVIGSSGLIPRAWHWSYLRHGAPQVHGRFERMHKRRMTEEDWAAWVAMRAIAEAIVRFKDNENFSFNDTFINKEFKLDGSKGPVLNFRSWNRQLRQPIMLSTENWVTSIAPLSSFVHRENNLDTIGMDNKTSKCAN